MPSAKVKSVVRQSEKSGSHSIHHSRHIASKLGIGKTSYLPSESGMLTQYELSLRATNGE